MTEPRATVYVVDDEPDMLKALERLLGGGQDDRRGVPHPFDGDAFADRLWRAIRAVRASRSGSSGGEQRPDIAPGDSGRDHSFDQRDHA
jgi:hypothetical protein